MNKKIAIPVAIVSVVVIALAAGACWYMSTPSGKDMALERNFKKVASTNRSDNFRQALPTVLPKNRPAEFEYFYENRDDQADYTESVLVSPTESYVRISTKGEIKTIPITVSDDTRDALYDALFTIPLDQVRVQSLPLNMPVPGEIMIGDKEPVKTKVETVRASFGQNQSDRQNLVYVSGPTTEITDQSRANWDIARGLGLEILSKFRPKQ